MSLSRREFVSWTIGGGAALALGAAPSVVWGEAATIEAVKEYVGGAATSSEGVTIGTPEIAENGNTVPVSFEIAGDAANVKEVRVFADGNPAPGVATFYFGPLAAAANASTRVRLAKTQNIVVVAKMADGSARVASREVKVTIGGCGG